MKKTKTLTFEHVGADNGDPQSRRLAMITKMQGYILQHQGKKVAFNKQSFLKSFMSQTGASIFRSKDYFEMALIRIENMKAAKVTLDEKTDTFTVEDWIE